MNKKAKSRQWVFNRRPRVRLIAVARELMHRHEPNINAQEAVLEAIRKHKQRMLQELICIDTAIEVVWTIEVDFL